MEGGDIDNRVGSSVIVVFDDLIGQRVEQVRELDSWAKKLIRWPMHTPGLPDTVIGYRLDQTVVGAINRLTHSTDVVVEIATFGDDVEAITTALDEAGLMYRSIGHTSPEHLAQSLAYAPHVSAVYHGYPAHSLTYGPRGRLVTPAQRAQIGRF